MTVELPLFLTQRPHEEDAVGVRKLPPVVKIGAVRIGGSGKTPNGESGAAM